MDSSSFLFQSFIFLGAAVLMLPVAKRLGLGSVLGYLLAGIVIGPFVLGLIETEGEDIMHFAEFGVVMMLFIIGLELEPALLWKMRKKILGLGSLQVIISALLIGGITLFFGMSWKESLVIGLILSLSSTAIVLQTLNEKDLLRTTGGQASFSVLLFQDMAVIPMLAIFPLLAPSDAPAAHGPAHANWVSHQSPTVHGLIVFGSIALIILGGRYLVRPLLREIARTQLREAFTATALFLVVGIAVWMTYLGLSAALGTFLAGVVLANSEFKHELESDIEPFKGLLLGLFFVAVGASIDFDLVLSKPLLILAIVIALVVIKAGVLWILGSFFGLRRRQRLLFAAALSQVGEFAFVLLSLTQARALLPSDIVHLLIAAVAISMALTPFIMLVYDHLPLVTRKKAEEELHENIEERNPVIIAGFGHFGNTIGRFLRANGVSATYLDIDAERVALLRRMGFNVYYGDASRREMLLSAGADAASIIIIALDNKEKRMEMVHTIKKHFPHLKIFMRASNRYDAYKHIEAGVNHIYRESIDASLRLGADVLASFGVRRYAAQRSARQFFRYDEATVAKLSIIKDESAYLKAVNEFTTEIEALMAVEKSGTFIPADNDWDNATLKEEYGSQQGAKH